MEEHLLACADCAARVEQARGPASDLVAAGDARGVLTDARLRSGTFASLSSAAVAYSSASDIVPASSISIEDSVAGSGSVSLEHFLASLSQSGLLSPLDVAALRERSSSDPAANNVTSVIGWLVKEHKLTHYQAQVLARGKGRR